MEAKPAFPELPAPPLLGGFFLYLRVPLEQSTWKEKQNGLKGLRFPTFPLLSRHHVGLPALVSQPRTILLPLTLASERMVSGREGLPLNIPPVSYHLPVGIGAGWSGGSFLPSFLQREGCLIQAQARTVVKSKKRTSDSRMASSSIVPARTAGKGMAPKDKGEEILPEVSRPAGSLFWSPVLWAGDKGLRWSWEGSFDHRRDSVLSVGV